MKESFVFYKSWKEALQDVPDEIRLEVYDCIIEYALSGKVPSLKPMAKMAFNFIKNDLDRSSEKYQRTVERNKLNGSKGGRPKTSDNQPNKTTQPNPNNPVGFSITQYNPNEDDNDNDNDNDILLEKETKEIPPKNLIEDDLVNPEIEQRKKVAQKKEIEYPFPTKEFKAGWDLWKAYRKKKDKFQYFDEVSEKKALSELFNLSKMNESTALAIIRQSIDKGWKGFFELKNTTNGNNKPTTNGTPNLALARRR